MAIQTQMRRLLMFFIALFVVVSGFLVYWQTYWPVADAQQYTKYQQCIASDQPIRGRIYDRNGVLLAWSVQDPNSPCGWRRHYATAAHPSISSFLGYFSYIYGSTGLEHYYNDILSGQTGSTTDFNAASQQYLNKVLHRPVYGQDIYLSIDVRIQDYVAQHFFDQVTGGVCTSGSQLGSIIVENPQTGELLAMVSRPYFNGDTIGDTTVAPDNPRLTVGEEYWNKIVTDPNSPLLNRAVQGQYPPGSTFKTLTLGAAIDSGKYTVHTTFSQQDATTYTVDGFKIDSNNLGDYTHGPQPASFPLELGHAYAYSDNVVFARVGVGLGADTWLSYTKKFSMSTPGDPQSIPIDTFPSGSSDVYTQGSFDQVLLASSAFGQGQLFLSPMTMSMIVSAVGANGNIFAPRLELKAVPYSTTDPIQVAKNTPNNDPVALGQAFSPDAANQVLQAMRDVVTYGSVGASGGPIASIANLPMTIGGKTGTAQLSSGNPHAWFISLAPDNGYTGGGGAQLSVIVMKERGGEGACQAPVAGNIYTYALPLLSGDGIQG